MAKTAPPQELDRRLQERRLRQGEISQRQIEELALAGPDCAGRMQGSSQEELEKLAEELAGEKRVRDERIQEALEKGEPAPTLQPPPAPLDDEL